MGTHSVQAGMIHIDVGNRFRGTGFGTGWITTAEITFNYLRGILVVIDSSERASDGAYLTANTNVVNDIFRAGGRINNNRLHRASVKTPRFRALGAGIGRETAEIVKGKHFDS